LNPKPTKWENKGILPGGKSAIRHSDNGTPMGYSFPYEVHIGYAKDSWCHPSCMCLHQAAGSGDIGRVAAAVKGEEPFTRKHSINQLDEHGRTPAMIAAWRGERAVLRWLVEHGADLNVCDLEGRSVLHWCVCVERAAAGLCSDLADANINPIVKDRHGDTVLHKCVQKNMVKAAKALAVAFPHLCIEKDRKGRMPIDLAAPEKFALRKAVELERAMEHVREEQRLMVIRITQEEEQSKKEKEEKALRAADIAAKKRREALVKDAQGGGSFVNVVAAAEVDEFELLNEDREDDDVVDKESVSFFTTLANDKDIQAQSHQLDMQMATKKGWDAVRNTKQTGKGGRRSSIHVAAPAPPPTVTSSNAAGRRKGIIPGVVSNAPLIPAELLRL